MSLDNIFLQAYWGIANETVRRNYDCAARNRTISSYFGRIALKHHVSTSWSRIGFEEKTNSATAGF